MKPPQHIKSKLKNADPEIHQFVSELLKQDKKRQSHTIKLEAENEFQKNEIAALKKQYRSELKKPKIIIQKFDVPKSA